MSAYTVVFLLLFGVRIEYFREECHALSLRPPLWISIVKRDIGLYIALELCGGSIHSPMNPSPSQMNIHCILCQYSPSFDELMRTTNNRELTK